MCTVEQHARIRGEAIKLILAGGLANKFCGMNFVVMDPLAS